MRPLRVLRWMFGGLFVVVMVAVVLAVIVSLSGLLIRSQCPKNMCVINCLGPKQREFMPPERDQMDEYLHYPGSTKLEKRRTWLTDDPPEKVFSMYKQKMRACSSYWGITYENDLFMQLFPANPRFNGTVINIGVRQSSQGTEITIEFLDLSYS